MEGAQKTHTALSEDTALSVLTVMSGKHTDIFSPVSGGWQRLLSQPEKTLK